MKPLDLYEITFIHIKIQTALVFMDYALQKMEKSV